MICYTSVYLVDIGLNWYWLLGCLFISGFCDVYGLLIVVYGLLFFVSFWLLFYCLLLFGICFLICVWILKLFSFVGIGFVWVCSFLIWCFGVVDCGLLFDLCWLDLFCVFGWLLGLGFVCDLCFVFGVC